MFRTLFKLFRPILFKFPPEKAHDLMIQILSKGHFLIPDMTDYDPFKTPYLTFNNRVGLAAGFDKNALAVEAFLKLGFGFVEIGTVTPKPQSGNPQPRLFRLAEDEAIINRMGFNNDGAEVICERMNKLRDKGIGGVIGVNIGANKDSEDRLGDYAKAASYFLNTASYFTVNVSSPNTQGLRDLQAAHSLDKLLTSVLEVTQKHKEIPVFLKISPDRQDYNLIEMLELVNKLPISGLIVSNTTIERAESLRSEAKEETGGLSGKPLFKPSTALLREVKQSLSEDKILIGVGGISSQSHIKAKIEAGADLVQIYSGLIYHGLDILS